MINELQSVNEYCQGKQSLIEEFDIKFVYLTIKDEKDNDF